MLDQILFFHSEGWTDAGSSGIRKANLRINDASGSAEITALSFPGNVGGNLANVNRWCGQIELNTRVKRNWILSASQSQSLITVAPTSAFKVHKNQS